MDLIKSVWLKLWVIWIRSKSRFWVRIRRIGWNPKFLWQSQTFLVSNRNRKYLLLKLICVLKFLKNCFPWVKNQDLLNFWSFIWPRILGLILILRSGLTSLRAQQTKTCKDKLLTFSPSKRKKSGSNTSKPCKMTMKCSKVMTSTLKCLYGLISQSSWLSLGSHWKQLWHPF